MLARAMHLHAFYMGWICKYYIGDIHNHSNWWKPIRQGFRQWLAPDGNAEEWGIFLGSHWQVQKGDLASINISVLWVNVALGIKVLPLHCLYVSTLYLSFFSCKMWVLLSNFPFTRLWQMGPGACWPVCNNSLSPFLFSQAPISLHFLSVSKILILSLV